jgi:TolA-binding protein
MTTDPLPLIEEGASPFEEELLRAGRSDSLSSSGRRRIMTGLGIGGGLLAASTIASGVKATTAKGFFSTVGLGATVGAVGALAVWAGVALLSPSELAPIPAKVATTTPVAKKAAPVDAPPAPVAEEPVDVAPEPKTQVKPATPTRGAVPNTDSLAEELAAIEDARSALGRRDYAAALRQLDDYTRRFSKRRLDSEATVLRIETLAAKGDREAAARLGKSFLAGHPNGPYARRVRSLVGDP